MFKECAEKLKFFSCSSAFNGIAHFFLCACRTKEKLFQPQPPRVSHILRNDFKQGYKLSRSCPCLKRTLGQMGKADCRQRLCTFAKANGKKPFCADNQAISKNCGNELLPCGQRSRSRKSFFGFFRIF